jgi:hypothetical protein
LQILDDGVLTSGRGDRVYFSEALIVFTSNLGIYRTEPDGSRVANVSSDDAFTDVQAKVRLEIERYFKTVLNRPEILNRIGDNIVVFDFIRPSIRLKVRVTELSHVCDGRAVVYRRAKNALDKRPFGTQYDVYADGYEWLRHSIAPRPHAITPFRVMVGDLTARLPITRPFSISRR